MRMRMRDTFHERFKRLCEFSPAKNLTKNLSVPLSVLKLKGFGIWDSGYLEVSNAV